MLSLFQSFSILVVMSSSCSTTRAIRPWRHSGDTASENVVCENWGYLSSFLRSGLGSGAGNRRLVKRNRQLCFNNFIMMPNKLLKHLLSKRICFSVSATPSNVTPEKSSPHTLSKWVDISCQCSVQISAYALLCQTWIDVHLNYALPTNNFKKYTEAACTL